MRERHNIVGSEVGQARPPVYFRTPVGRRTRSFRTQFLVALTIVLAAALVTVLVIRF